MLPKFQRRTPEEAADTKPLAGIGVTITFSHGVTGWIREDHNRKRKTLGLVDRHQLDPVCVLLKKRCFAGFFCSGLVIEIFYERSERSGRAHFEPSRQVNDPVDIGEDSLAAGTEREADMRTRFLQQTG